MYDFNLLVSTSRYNEPNCKAELWFTIMMCGDKYPIISDLEFIGLIAASTTLDAKQFIRDVRTIVEKDPAYFQYILKIVPIDYVCETNVEIINQIVKRNYKNFIEKGDSFKITLNRRKNDVIDREKFIRKIASNIHNKVDLDNPDKTLRFEILGRTCGISFLEKGDVLRVVNRYNYG